MKIAQLLLLSFIPFVSAACEPARGEVKVETPAHQRTHHRPTTDVVEQLRAVLSAARDTKDQSVQIYTDTPVRHVHISAAIRLVYPGARPRTSGLNGAKYFETKFIYYFSPDSAPTLIKRKIQIK